MEKVREFGRNGVPLPDVDRREKKSWCLSKCEGLLQYQSSRLSSCWPRPGMDFTFGVPSLGWKCQQDDFVDLPTSVHHYMVTYQTIIISNEYCPNCSVPELHLFPLCYEHLPTSGS